MVKVALQLSGRLRYTEKSLGSLIGAIIETLNPDVFCSFWETENEETKIQYKTSLNPKLIEYEDQTFIKPYLDELFQYNVHVWLPSMSYKFYKVNTLRRSWEHITNQKYDVVIQARSDNIFFEKLSLEHCKLSLNEDKILCANQLYTHDIDHYISSPRMVDNFYLGPAELINKANSTFWHLKEMAHRLTGLNLLHHVRIPEIIQTIIWRELGCPIGGLSGCGEHGNFLYDIDRDLTPWK